MMRPNRLKRKLEAGERPVGCWIFLAGTDSIELLSLLGFDAFIIDHEHISASPRGLVEQMRAAQATDITCLVRVPSDDPVYIKRVLDAGIEGILVPTVESAGQMAAIVAACRYRPHGGHRGVGYPEARAADWGLGELDYPGHYRDNLLIAALVETRKGMENVEEIVAVEGVDMVMPGAGDLLADLVSGFDDVAGYGDYDNPELHQLLAEAERVVKRSAAWLCGTARHAAGARALLERGYDFVTASADTWLLMDGAKRTLAEVKGD